MLEKVDNHLIELLRTGKLQNPPLLVCSGGTTSRCAAHDHWTLDLRNFYKKIKFINKTKEVEIGGGVLMSDLIDQLYKYNYSFPIGLSGKTGMGYILTGGISPMSRSEGLAIDKIKQIEGFFGNGEKFLIKRPNESSSNDIKLLWKGLCGAAPYLAIVTKVRLKTVKLEPIVSIYQQVDLNNLTSLIQASEEAPQGISLQWIWANKIYMYLLVKRNDQKSIKFIEELKSSNLINNNSIYMNHKKLNDLPILQDKSQNIVKGVKNHSEVLGLLGPKWGDNTKNIINIVRSLIKLRPNDNCSIASQQLGEVTKTNNTDLTSFIHRDAVWKPWITASWPAGDSSARLESLKWMEEAWSSLSNYCPGIHQAQMHPHLSWYKKEIKSAFGHWLPELQRLKLNCDPNGMLPPL